MFISASFIKQKKKQKTPKLNLLNVLQKKHGKVNYVTSMKWNTTQRSKTIMQKVVQLTLSNLTTYHKGTVTKDKVILAKEQTYRSMEQNRDPRSRLTKIVNWSLTKVQRQFSGERRVFQYQMWFSWTSIHISQPYIKIHLKQITGLNVK